MTYAHLKSLSWIQTITIPSSTKRYVANSKLPTRYQLPYGSYLQILGACGANTRLHYAYAAITWM